MPEEFYKIMFPGFWLGGVAIVLAENEAEARELFQEEVQKHPPLTLTPAEVSVERILAPGSKVLYFDDGDY